MRIREPRKEENGGADDDTNKAHCEIENQKMNSEVTSTWVVMNFRESRIDVMMNFDHDLTVHNYSDTTLSQQSLLNYAYDLIRTSNWVNVKSNVLEPAPFFRLVEYPQFVNDALSNLPRDVELDNWDAPLPEHPLSLHELEEFEVTDLEYIFIEPPLQVDAGPLHRVIAQPHFYPSPTPTLSKPVKQYPYDKALPSLIPPRTEPFSPLEPQYRYSRCAWLVPIRGKPPWHQCTSATILDSSLDYTLKQKEIEHRNEEIIWTHDSLRDFWNFLLTLRTKGVSGAIGLSFHASRPSRHSAITQSLHTHSNTTSIPYSQYYHEQDVTPFLAKFDSIPSPANSPSQSLHFNTNTNPRIVLSTLDHIKIYHEARYTMHLRNFLHLWSHACPGSSGNLKRRVLKGATLALLDERSNGILSC
ncbi:hypothetical protein H0H93_001603 [Arthromyces matolae]|nr:hypothetical protein H0H93_001603 [Arthromyces matolae]